MKTKKKLKDYPTNVPRKLIRVLKECNFDRSMLAQRLDVNGGYISNLLNKGIEPTDSTKLGRTVRKKIFLKAYKEEHRKINRTIQKEPLPEWMKKWRHMSKEERHKVIQTYVEWKEKNK